MLLSLFLRDGSHWHVQAVTNDLGDFFEPHALFGDGMIPGSRRAFFESEPVKTSGVEPMYGRPAVLTITDIS
jgi:hypothetical protein